MVATGGHRIKEQCNIMSNEQFTQYLEYLFRVDRKSVV